MKGLCNLDRKTIKRYGGLVAGVDEVGMAPLAGPVCACALVVNKGPSHRINLRELQVDDSKKLSRQQRQTLFPRIVMVSTYGLGWVSVPELDAIRNLQEAGNLARTRAVQKLVKQCRPKSIISDFFDVKVELATAAGCVRRIPCVHVAKADQKSFVVACASIVAKVLRDDFMMKAHREYPWYGWYNNVGYPTNEHWDGIKCHGVTPLHRMYIVSKMLARTGWKSMFSTYSREVKEAQTCR